ncbi:MAG: alpha/beta hydrolase [Chitinophagaceae bacterium]
MSQQKVIQLYDGPEKGSETWNWPEGEVFVGNPMNAKVAYNVTKPSLEVYQPDSANGVSVILCPGGSFYVLNIEYEGSKVAKELNKKGITVFLFKYRLLRSFTNDPWKEMMEARKNPDSLLPKIMPLRNMAIADLDRAILFVRQHALEYKIDPKRIGVMGFSAGGVLAANLAYHYTSDTKPAFVAPIYSVITNINDRTVKADAPPLFIAAATDDQLAPVSNSVNLYSDWINAKKSAELHLYSKGGHGLRGTPASTWINRFTEWLSAQGFLNRK